MPFIDIRKASSDIAIEGNTFVAGQNSILIAAEQGNEAYGFPSSMGNINVTGNTVTKSSEDIDGSTIVLFEIVCDDGSSLYPYAPIYVTDNVAASDVMVLNVIYRDSDGNVTAENVMYDEWIVENGYVLTKVSEPLIDCNLTIEVADIFLGEDAVVTVTVPSNATGEITISLNGASYSNTIAGGQSVFNIGDLAVGTYTVIAAYSGDEKYGEAQANKTFNVAEPPKVDPVIEFAIDSVVYPNDLVINVAAPSDATGWVNVTLGNHTYELALAGGKATQSISDLNAGYYAVFAVYSGDDKYNNCSYDLNATVLKAESSIALNNTEFDYSDDIEVGYALVGAHDFTAVVADCPDASVAYEGGVIHISGITAGTHTIQFTTVPDENYNEAVVNVTITVNKVDSTLTVPEVVFNYGESGVSTVTFDGATGVNAVVNDLGAVVDVDGNVITVSGLTAGNYVLTVTTVPDANHNEVTKTANVTVNKVDSAATMDNIEFDYGSSGTTVVTLTGAVNFTASVNDDKAVVSVDGNVIAVSGLDADSYTLTVTTVPDANHNSVSVNATVTVSKVDSTVGVNGIVFDYGSIGTAAVTFTGATNVTASVNDGKAVVSVDGNVISVSGLDAGSYVLTVTTVPDANHVAVEATANVTVNRVDSSISFTNDLAFVYGESDSTNFTVVGATVNETGISVDGHPEAVISLNGNVITVSGLASGKYTLKVTTIPDENHNSVEGVASITVTGIDPALTVSVADIYEGSSAVVAVTTNSAFTGNVTVQIGDANYSVAVTDGKGSVSVSGLAVGTYTATADFKATPVFKESAKNVTFTVNAKIKTSIKAISVITTYGTSKNIVVILSEANGKPIAGKTVTVILNGAKKELTTDGRGQVSYAVGTDLAPKKYTASITFAGDAKYVKSSGSAKVTVNKATAKLTAKNKSFKVKKTKKYTITLKTDKNKALKKGKVTIKVGKVKITKTTNSKGKATFNLKKLSKKGKYKGTVKFAGNKYYKPVSSKIKITIK
jgi:hypothetical protein